MLRIRVFSCFIDIKIFFFWCNLHLQKKNISSEMQLPSWTPGSPQSNANITPLITKNSSAHWCFWWCFSDDPANTPTSSVQDVLMSRSQEEPMDHNMIETVYRNIDASAFILHMMSEWSSNLQIHLGGDMERGQGILDQTCTRKIVFPIAVEKGNQADDTCRI